MSTPSGPYRSSIQKRITAATNRLRLLPSPIINIKLIVGNHFAMICPDGGWSKGRFASAPVSFSRHYANPCPVLCLCYPFPHWIDRWCWPLPLNFDCPGAYLLLFVHWSPRSVHWHRAPACRRWWFADWSRGSSRSIRWFVRFRWNRVAAGWANYWRMSTALASEL
jgi:hypothetical protein